MSHPQGPPGSCSLALTVFFTSTLLRKLGRGRKTHIWDYLLCARLCHALGELTFAQAISHVVARGVLSPSPLCCCSLVQLEFSQADCAPSPVLGSGREQTCPMELPLPVGDCVASRTVYTMVRSQWSEPRASGGLILRQEKTDPGGLLLERN